MENHPLITLNEKSVLGQILNRKLVDAFSNPLESRIIVETYHIAKRLVKQKAGIAIIDSITAYSGDSSGLKFYPLEPAIRAKTDLITRVNEPISAHSQRMIDVLKDTINAFSAK